MYDEGAKFDLMWTPPQYPWLNPEDSGVWRTLLDDDDDPVGIVWSNRKDASGVMWATQTDAATRLYKYFSQSARGGVPAFPAYVNAESLPGVKLGKEQSGRLTGAQEAIQAILDDTDEASS